MPGGPPPPGMGLPLPPGPPPPGMGLPPPPGPPPGMGLPPPPGGQEMLPPDGQYIEGQAFDDGLTEEERKKEELNNNPEFKKYLTMYKVKIPLVQIKQKIQQDGVFNPMDIELFAAA